MAEGDGLDCLDLLEETPAILRGLMRELSHEDTHWKPAPNRAAHRHIGLRLSTTTGKRRTKAAFGDS